MGGQGALLDARDVATLAGAAALAFAVCLRPAALQSSPTPPRLSSDLGMVAIIALLGFAEAMSGIPQALGLPPPIGGRQPFDGSILHAILAVCTGIAVGSLIAHRWGTDALTPLLIFHAAWMVFLGADDLYRFIPEAPSQDFLGSVETRIVDLILLVNNVMLGPVLVVWLADQRPRARTGLLCGLLVSAGLIGQQGLAPMKPIISLRPDWPIDMLLGAAAIAACIPIWHLMSRERAAPELARNAQE